MILHKEYFALGKTRVRSWPAWSVFGLVTIIAMSMVFIAIGNSDFGQAAIITSDYDPTNRLMVSTASLKGTTFYADEGAGVAKVNYNDIKIYMGPEAVPNLYWLIQTGNPGIGVDGYLGRKVGASTSAFIHLRQISSNNGDSISDPKLNGDSHLEIVRGTNGKQLWLSYGCGNNSGSADVSDNCVVQSTDSGANFNQNYKRFLFGPYAFHEPNIHCNSSTDCMLVVGNLPIGKTGIISNIIGGDKIFSTIHANFNGKNWSEASQLLPIFAPIGYTSTGVLGRYAYAYANGIGTMLGFAVPVTRGSLIEGRSANNAIAKMSNGQSLPQRYVGNILNDPKTTNPVVASWIVGAGIETSPNGRRVAVLADKNCVVGWNNLCPDGTWPRSVVGAKVWTESSRALNDLSGPSVTWDGGAGVHLITPNVVYDNSGSGKFYAFYTKVHPTGITMTDLNLAGCTRDNLDVTKCNGHIRERHDICYRTLGQNALSWSPETCPVTNVKSKTPASTSDGTMSYTSPTDPAEGDLIQSGAASNGKIAIIYRDECLWNAAFGGQFCKIKIWTGPGL